MTGTGDGHEQEGAFRSVAGRFATGVAVATAVGPDGPVGMTVNSFTTVSLSPRMLLVCLRRDCRLLGAVRRTGRFAVTVLADDQRAEAAWFASRGRPSGADGFTGARADSPLPVRMRPAGIDELVGQEHLLAPGAPLRQLVEGAAPMSVILWGPPGSGKTTIAYLVARATDRRFVAMSALTAGVKDVRAVIETARRQRRSGGPPTVLFIDEVHRFSKTQQDSLLAAVEDRTVTLLAATTENPYFSVISPLLSRCVLLTLQALDDDDVRGLLRRAVADERGLGGALVLAEEAEDHLVRLAGGDVRKALTALEAAAATAT
ncbi:hypothetical protein DLJ57_22010, partial [Micromonospora chalcea]